MSMLRKINSSYYGFAAIELIMGIAIIVLVGVVAYMAIKAASDKRSVSDAPTTAKVAPQATGATAEKARAYDHIKQFYKTWLGYVLSDSSDPTKNASAYPTSKWVSDGYVTQPAADQQDDQYALDMPTCSQNPLTNDEYRFDQPVLSGTAGTMTITGQYPGMTPDDKSDDSVVTIKLGLVADGPTWKINSFDCSTPASKAS